MEEESARPHVEISKPPPSQPILSSGVKESDERVSPSEITIPGALLYDHPGFMRGHGSYVDGEKLLSSVAGRIEQVNRLISVKPVKCRYQGEVGDVVVGRIVEVQQKRWKVDTGSRLHSALLLNSVNLPGGELRRKDIEDELAMREYLKEGDLVSAEVQQRHGDGALALHTRSLKYGKLGQGVLVKVPAHLIKRRKTFICNLHFGVSVIFGCNGWVWIARPINEQSEAYHGGYLEDTTPIPRSQHESIARVANCVRLLAESSLPLYDTSVTAAFKASAAYETRELIKREVANGIGDEVLKELRRHDNG